MTLKESFFKRLFCIIFAVLYIVLNAGCSAQAVSADGTGKAPAQTQGYRAVCDSDGDYIAVGTGGRIDRIKTDKTVTRVPSATSVSLNDVISSNGMIVAVGDGGVIRYSKNGVDFKSANSGTKRSLYGVTSFRGAFYAVGAKGLLLCSYDGEHWNSRTSGLKNNILSISANDKLCMAVTREGQILVSAEGTTWDVTDYNALYQGYSELFWFHSIRACGNAFVLLGEYQKNTGSPGILSSETGEVWRELAFTKINDKPTEEYLPLIANAAVIDWDQLVVACSGGKLLTVTECSECNKLDILCKQEINDLASANGYLALVGSGFWFDIRKSDAFRQYSIRAEQAQMDYKNGAYLVDVRTDEEYAQKHIKGAIHIPIDQVDAELEKWIPDKSSEIIFYCAKGVRAQKALENARIMGYEKIYNLGGISDWPYETEAGSSSGEK